MGRWRSRENVLSATACALLNNPNCPTICPHPCSRGGNSVLMLSGVRISRGCRNVTGELPAAHFTDWNNPGLVSGPVRVFIRLMGLPQDRDGGPRTTPERNFVGGDKPRLYRGRFNPVQENRIEGFSGRLPPWCGSDSNSRFINFDPNPLTSKGFVDIFLKALSESAFNYRRGTFLWLVCLGLGYFIGGSIGGIFPLEQRSQPLPDLWRAFLHKFY